MGRAVLLSIQPKWCELIASGKKTVEVRKTKPKLETPFKCYIYETKDAHFEHIGVHYADGQDFIHHIGKVIGEFVCDSIKEFYIPYPAYFASVDCDTTRLLTDAMLTKAQAHRYLKTKRGYCWHISDLKIYDEPKNKVEFCHPCDRDPQCDCRYCVRYAGNKPILRAPQSWCYVEQLQNEYSGGHHE